MNVFVLMLLSPFVYADEFYWYGYASSWDKEYTNKRFPSPTTACAELPAAINSVHWEHSGPTYVTDITAKRAACHYLAKNIRYQTVTNTMSYVRRAGSTCPVGTHNNITTGECANDQQKGPPQNFCEATPKAETGFVHNPINSANGNKYQAEVDYSNGGLSPLGFSRTYNSLDGKWRHSYSTYLRIADTNIALVMAHGRESFFTFNGSTITAVPTERGQLVRLADGWEYTSENNERFTFDTTGRLTRWSTPSAAQQLVYANDQVTVTDHLGNSLSFTEDAQHQPLSLRAGDLQITYNYNATKRLTQLTRTRGDQSEQRQFHYEDPRNNALLTGITDERGVRYATWSYDDKGRAISSEHANGAERGTVAYNADGSSTVTNEFGKKTTYRFVTIGGIKRVSAIEGEASANCPNSNSTFTYDSRGLLKTKTDNKGHLTTYDYNERGLEVSRTEAAGTSEARTISTEWHPTLFLRTKVTEPGRVTTYRYDAQGRQLSQTKTDR